MADRVGQRFGDYCLIRFLGEGTFGDVYFGEQVYEKSPAAVKVFKAKLTPDKFKDFINEVRTVLLRHPNIVQILDFGISSSPIPKSRICTMLGCLSRTVRTSLMKSLNLSGVSLALKTLTAAGLFSYTCSPK